MVVPFAIVLADDAGLLEKVRLDLGAGEDTGAAATRKRGARNDRGVSRATLRMKVQEADIDVLLKNALSPKTDLNELAEARTVVVADGPAVSEALKNGVRL